MIKFFGIVRYVFRGVGMIFEREGYVVLYLGYLLDCGVDFCAVFYYMIVIYVFC